MEKDVAASVADPPLAQSLGPSMTGALPTPFVLSLCVSASIFDSIPSSDLTETRRHLAKIPQALAGLFETVLLTQKWVEVKEAMKALVTGAFSTGKSILISAVKGRMLADGLPCKLLPDIGRDCPFPINSRQSSSTSLWLAARQIGNEILACTDVEPRTVVVCDRGIPDILSHAAVSEGRLAQDFHSRALWGLGIPWISSYDKVFVTSIDDEIEIEADGIREPSKLYQKVLQTSLFQTLSDVLGNRLVFLPTDPTERLNTVIGTLKDAVL